MMQGMIPMCIGSCRRGSDPGLGGAPRPSRGKSTGGEVTMRWIFGKEQFFGKQEETHNGAFKTILGKNFVIHYDRAQYRLTTCFIFR